MVTTTRAIIYNTPKGDAGRCLGILTNQAGKAGWQATRGNEEEGGEGGIGGEGKRIRRF